MKKTKLLKYIILGAVAALVATFMLPKRESRKGHPRDYAEIAQMEHFVQLRSTIPSAFMWMETLYRAFITN